MTRLRRAQHAFLPALLLVIACSGAVEPRGLTLLVTNGTCQAASCTPLHVLGFPSNQPLTPAGYWSIDLGLITTPSACLTFPPSATFRIIGVSNDGTADTTTFTWTPGSALSLGVQDSSTPRFWAAPSTSAFVPANGSGWSVSLPGGSRVSPSQTCTP